MTYSPGFSPGVRHERFASVAFADASDGIFPVGSWTSVLACVFSCHDAFRIRSNRNAVLDSWAKSLVRRLPHFLFPPCLIGQFIGPSDREEFER